jgi:hemerythrin HHE cation binding domain-containing protein
MKRSAALAPLSRDHQHALDAALRLRRGEPGAVEYFRRFFESEGRRHFEIEEELILSALPADDEEWQAGVERVRSDHEAVRRAVARDDLEGADAQALGAKLTAHVRFEERVLFPILEQRLSRAALERLGAAIERAESP